MLGLGNNGARHLPLVFTLIFKEEIRHISFDYFFLTLNRTKVESLKNFRLSLRLNKCIFVILIFTQHNSFTFRLSR